jgi:hypothetical protein
MMAGIAGKGWFTDSKGKRRRVFVNSEGECVAFLSILSRAIFIGKPGECSTAQFGINRARVYSLPREFWPEQY